MIKTLKIKNFKSIKNLEIEAKRINLFIGEPNTGKSNILEALGLLSFLAYGEFGSLKDFVRLERGYQLLRNENPENKIEIIADEKSVVSKIEGRDLVIEGDGKDILYLELKSFSLSKKYIGFPNPFSPIKFYRFRVLKEFRGDEFSFLLPPSGGNIVKLLTRNEELREFVSDFLSPEWKLNLRPFEDKIEVMKEERGAFISFPISLFSETLWRVIFHLLAIKSNRDSVIVFEEPEAHAFPYYVRYLSKQIAFDEKNQYFISTHNVIFVRTIVEKAKKDVNVFLTFMENYETKVKPLGEDEKEKLLETDIFFNIEDFKK